MNPASAAQAASSIFNVGRVVLFGGAAVYGLSNSLFNVEGGHRAIVFNRVFGIKETVRCGPMREPRSMASDFLDRPLIVE
jgi:prohibitin 2